MTNQKFKEIHKETSITGFIKAIRKLWMRNVMKVENYVKLKLILDSKIGKRKIGRRLKDG